MRWRSGWVKGSAVAPRLMKVLSIVGTLAMFLVGGGLSFTVLRRCIMPSSTGARGWGVMASTLPVVANTVLGFIIGAVVLAGVKAVSSLRGAGK